MVRDRDNEGEYYVPRKHKIMLNRDKGVMTVRLSVN